MERETEFYIIFFNHVDLTGDLVTKDSVNDLTLDKMVESGEIISYVVDDIGVKVKKKIILNQR